MGIAEIMASHRRAATAAYAGLVAALAIGANHLVTLVAQSMELLRAAGVGAPDRMLGPLLGAAVTVQVNGADPAVPPPSVAVTTGW